MGKNTTIQLAILAVAVLTLLFNAGFLGQAVQETQTLQTERGPITITGSYDGATATVSATNGFRAPGFASCGTLTQIMYTGDSRASIRCAENEKSIILSGTAQAFSQEGGGYGVPFSLTLDNPNYIPPVTTTTLQSLFPPTGNADASFSSINPIFIFGILAVAFILSRVI